MPETTPLIKAALNLRVGAGFDVYAKLGIGIDIKSEVGVYTTVLLHFPKSDHLNV